MSALPYESQEEGWDSYREDEDLELPGRPRRRFLNWGSAVLLALAVGGIGFYVGVRVEKGQLSNSSSSAGAFPGAAAAARSGAAGAAASDLPAPSPGAAGRRARRRGGAAGPQRLPVRSSRWRQQLVWDGLQRRRQDHLRDAGRHWERSQGHAVERDQDHQERGRWEVSDQARRHRCRLGRQGVERQDRRDLGQRHRRQRNWFGRRLEIKLQRVRAAQAPPSAPCSGAAADGPPAHSSGVAADGCLRARPGWRLMDCLRACPGRGLIDCPSRLSGPGLIDCPSRLSGPGRQ